MFKISHVNHKTFKKILFISGFLLTLLLIAMIMFFDNRSFDDITLWFGDYKTILKYRKLESIADKSKWSNRYLNETNIKLKNNSIESDIIAIFLANSIQGCSINGNLVFLSENKETTRWYDYNSNYDSWAIFYNIVESKQNILIFNYTFDDKISIIKIVDLNQFRNHEGKLKINSIFINREGISLKAISPSL